MKTQLKDIYWLAGIVEGEGCFSHTGKYYTPRFQLKMVDRDVVERVNRLMRPTMYRKNGNEVKCRACDSPGNRQPVYVATIAGRRAAGWMMTLYPLMGERRQARIRELITTWKSVGERSNGKTSPC